MPSIHDLLDLFLAALRLQYSTVKYDLGTDADADAEAEAAEVGVRLNDDDDDDEGGCGRGLAIPPRGRDPTAR